jgi:glycosyltransferase involved in cell wall biosynthesis
MKVLYLCPDLGIPVLGRKGASVHVRELVGALARAGLRVTLAAQTLTKSPAETPATVRARVIQVLPDPTVTTAVHLLKEFNECLGVENSLPGELRRILYNKQLARGLNRWFMRNRPAFIYERASLYATAGTRLAEKFKVPHIVELNAPLALEQSAYRSTGFGDLAAQAERWTLTHADAVIVVSNELRNHVLTLGVKRDKIHVMPNGVNPELFHPLRQGSRVWEERRQPLARNTVALGRDPATKSAGPVLGFVGGLRPWHGVEILPELLARLRKRIPALRLIIAGDGQLRGALEREFQRRGLTQHVTFTGALLHEDMPEVIRHFDIALAPYPRHDHDFYFSPLKLFEYMACGVAVVASDVGQISEVVTDGKNGLLYPPGSFKALVVCCERLLASAKLREELGDAAATLVRRKFTWDHNAAQVLKLARKLTAQRRG